MTSHVNEIWGKGKYEDYIIDKGWRPWVIISCAISLDGKLVSETGDSRLSSFEDKVEVHRLRSIVDGILVGVNTVLKDDPHLTISEKYYKSDKHPIRVVLDSKARTPPDSQVITKRPEVPTIIFVGRDAEKGNIDALVNAGAEVISVNYDQDGGLNLEEVLKILKSKYGINSLMVEGGGRVIGSFVKNRFVDYFRVSINPVLIGGKKSVSMVETVSFGNLDEAPRLELVKIELAGWSVIHHYLMKS